MMGSLGTNDHIAYSPPLLHIPKLVHTYEQPNFQQQQQQQPNFQQPGGDSSASISPHRSNSGAIAPVIVVLAIITILGFLAGIVSRLCGGRHWRGESEYDFEGWVEKRCGACIDGDIEEAGAKPAEDAPPPPPPEEAPPAPPEEPPPPPPPEEAPPPPPPEGEAPPPPPEGGGEAPPPA